MSIEATSWALNVDTVPDSTARVILLGLANHASRDGSAAWPSVATLAEYAVCSGRTVQRKLRDLEALGLLQKGDQRLVTHLPADRRPVVYDLPVGVTICRPVTESGVTPMTRRGDTAGTDGVTPLSPKPSMNHPEPSNPPKPPKGGGEQQQLLAPEDTPKRPRGFVYPDSFERFWAAWPKPGDTKRTAHTAWLKATEGTSKLPARVTAAELQQAVETFAADPNLPDPETEARFIPAAATWLNQDRWENGPLPGRGRTNSRPVAGDTHRAMQRSHTAAQKYRALEESGTQQGPHLIERRTA